MGRALVKGGAKKRVVTPAEEETKVLFRAQSPALALNPTLCGEKKRLKQSKGKPTNCPRQRRGRAHGDGEGVEPHKRSKV